MYLGSIFIHEKYVFFKGVFWKSFYADKYPAWNTSAPPPRGGSRGAASRVDESFLYPGKVTLKVQWIQLREVIS